MTIPFRLAVATPPVEFPQVALRRSRLHSRWRSLVALAVERFDASPPIHLT